MLILVLIFILFVLHIFGMQGLYYSTIFYDKILHLIGGLTVGLIGIEFFKKFKIQYTRVRIIFFVFTAGILWEVFEFIWDSVLVKNYNFPVMQLGLLDTLGDLLFDFLGCLLLLLLLMILQRKK